MSATKIIAVLGSLRAGSVNGAVARSAVATAGENIDIELISLADFPFYNGDVEETGVPSAVLALHEAIAAASGLLIFSPEYNGSFPAVTKNAIDWLTRPPKLWEGTAVSLVVTTPGPRAGGSLRGHFEAIMEHQPVRVMPSLGIGSYGEKVADGEVTDQTTRDEITTHVANFAAFCSEG